MLNHPKRHCLTAVIIPVSYTHLDVYKRQKYNRIEAVTGFPKGLPAPKPESEILVFDADEPDMEVFGKLPEWVQDLSLIHI